MTKLSTFVDFNFGGAMSVHEAEQLAFTLFCTLECLPENLREQKWDRARIAEEFASLAQEGYLCAVAPARRIPEFWSHTIDGFMSGEIEVDYDFRARLKV